MGKRDLKLWKQEAQKHKTYLQVEGDMKELLCYARMIGLYVCIFEKCSLMLFNDIFNTWFLFGCSAQHTGSQFPNQGSTTPPTSEAWRLNN